MFKTDIEQSSKLATLITFAKPIYNQQELDSFFKPLLANFEHDIQILSTSDFGKSTLSCEVLSTILDQNVDIFNNSTETLTAISNHANNEQSVLSVSLTVAEISTIDLEYTIKKVSQPK
ncbi:hypothetical protein [Photobacterium damselae]|uniref:hypothetical protein n=1 Tax=Photobacterium damselae TaxID=38293 RepID=UPI001F405F5A|nr:hypothetical protein [Photobacterium damselae]UKA05020.1 hypothetical protein IHC89_22500 [Photobacterium damselae subsp. damselae]